MEDRREVAEREKVRCLTSGLNSAPSLSPKTCRNWEGFCFLLLQAGSRIPVSAGLREKETGIYGLTEVVAAGVGSQEGEVQ